MDADNGVHRIRIRFKTQIFVTHCYHIIGALAIHSALFSGCIPCIG